MLGKYQGRWAFLSKKTGRPLAYAPGTEKPSDSWVTKQERRVQYFKHIREEVMHKANHVGTCVNSFDRQSGECTVSHLPYRDVSHFASAEENAHEVSKAHFLKHANVPKHLESLLQKKSTRFLHDKDYGVHMIHDTHKDVHHFFTEEYGAGEDGSEEASVKYQKDTPGQEKAHMPIRKHKTFKLQHELPEQYGMAGETLPAPSVGEDLPSHTKTLHTIKRVIRGKYKKGRSLI